MQLYRLISMLPVLLLASIVVLHGQPTSSSSDTASNPLRVVIGAKVGVVVTSPRGDFPSLLIGDSRVGSGDISSERTQTGFGSRWVVEAMIPFSPTLGMSVEFGTLHYVARYLGDNIQPATRFDVQTLQLAPRVDITVMTDRKAFATQGLRTVYFAVGLDISLATIANRVEGGAVVDSLSTRITRVGSFANSDPFRTLIALDGAVGLRFALEQHIELQAEAAYSTALNPVFSSDVVPGNNFTVDNFALQIGVGYRF